MLKLQQWSKSLDQQNSFNKALEVTVIVIDIIQVSKTSFLQISFTELFHKDPSSLISLQYSTHHALLYFYYNSLLRQKIIKTTQPKGCI